MKPTVFIGGYNRSGTTIAQAILDSSPELSITNEDSWIHALHYIFRRMIIRNNAEPLAFAPETIERRLPMLVTSWAWVWEQEHNNRKPEAKIIGDKLPASVLYFDWLRQIFPESKFIICTRNMEDTVRSWKKNVPQFKDIDMKDLYNGYKEWEVHVKAEQEKPDTFTIDYDKKDKKQYTEAAEFLGINPKKINLDLLNF